MSVGMCRMVISNRLTFSFFELNVVKWVGKLRESGGCSWGGTMRNMGTWKHLGRVRKRQVDRSNATYTVGHDAVVILIGCVLGDV